jgi:SAM-dependent methyltransferase
VHTKSSWHFRKSKTESIFVFNENGSSTQSFPFFRSILESASASDFVAICLFNIGAIHQNEILKFTAGGRTVGLALPLRLLDQPWRSSHPVSLLEEIETAILRLGYQFREIGVSRDASGSAWRRIVGKWHGWRHFSSRTASRAGGIAIEGSVLEETLEVLGDSMPRYAKWIYQQTVNPTAKSILEIGAGTGTMTGLLSFNATVVAVEPADDAREKLLTKCSNNEKVTVVENLGDAEAYAPFDQIVLINVLEHVEHDVALLREARRLLAIDGVLTVLSPAHNVLYSNFDAEIGHVRRYTRRTIRETFNLAGFEHVETRYFNMIGAALWLLVNRLLGKSAANESQTRLYDQVIVPVSAILDRVKLRLFGQSVIASSRNH